MPTVTIDEAMQIALHHHQAGELAQAETIYHQILAQEPERADAWHLLGVIASQRGDPACAVEWIERAIALNPRQADFRANLAEMHRRLGRLDLAIAAARAALDIDPTSAAAHANLAIALGQKGDWEGAAAAACEALRLQPNLVEAFNTLAMARLEQRRCGDAMELCRRALELRPDYAEAHNSLGVALRELDRPDEAIDACAMAIQLNPAYAEAHANLSVALLEAGRASDAVAAARAAIQLSPRLADAHSNLSIALAEVGDMDGAVTAAEAALDINPNHAGAGNNLGFALQKQGQTESAIRAYRGALKHDPSLLKARNNLGAALAERGDFDEAASIFQAIFAAQMDYADAHLNYGQILLAQGRLREGWVEYEWRLKTRSFSRSPRTTIPRWHGEELAGKSILLRSEQGLGDTLHLVRFVPLLAARGATVLLQCQAQLERIVASVSGLACLVPAGASPPACDWQCPLPSLPLLLDIDLQTVPASVPYLHPGPNLIETWRNRLQREGQAFRVGLAWAGSPEHANDRNRSMKLALMAPLARQRGVVFYSLQKGAPAAELASAPEGMRIVDLGTQVNDFADTAAILANLDLLISVDTAVVHMAGAMGKPVWTLLSDVPDWRWLLKREDSPWYPSMRLFRQGARGDWSELMERVARALVEKCGAGCGP